MQYYLPSSLRLCHSTSAYCNIIISCYHVIWESNQQFNSLPHNNLTYMMPASQLKTLQQIKLQKSSILTYSCFVDMTRYPAAAPVQCSAAPGAVQCSTCALCFADLDFDPQSDRKPDNKAAARTALTCKTAINCKQLTVM